jgi:rhamnosyltransferase subunit B
MGDVLPFSALGRTLAARGHSVAVAANPHFAHDAARAGLRFIPVGDEADYLALTATPDCVHGRRGLAAIMKYVTAAIASYSGAIAGHRPHAVVAHPLALAAPIADEKLGCAAITAYLSPAILQSAHLPPVLPCVPNGAHFPRWYKRAVVWAANHQLDSAVAPAVNALRAALGLPAKKGLFRDGGQRPCVGLFPEWFAPRQPDWPQQLTLAGFPAHDEGAAAPLPPELTQFLDGDAIVFTPGTGNRHAPQFFAAAVAATAQLGRRAILLTRFREQLPSSLPAHACWVPWAPLPSLLRQAAALVHHGGVGTLAAALGAGVPQLVTPLAHDQPDNAARLARLGVSETLAPRSFHPRAVTEALARLIASPVVAARCHELAGRMAGRNGLNEAADLIAGPGSALRRTTEKSWGALHERARAAEGYWQSGAEGSES